MCVCNPQHLFSTQPTNQVVLTLKCLGINDVLNFDYIDPPEEFHLLEALRQLYFFDAITATGEVNPLWRETSVTTNVLSGDPVWASYGLVPTASFPGMCLAACSQGRLTTSVPG